MTQLYSILVLKGKIKQRLTIMFIGIILLTDHNQFASINHNSAVELTISMEAFGHEHKQEMVQALIDHGYDPKIYIPNKLYLILV